MKYELTMSEIARVAGLDGATRSEAVNFMDENGGTLYTQVSCEEYTENGKTRTAVYIEGDHTINSTGVYAVV